MRNFHRLTNLVPKSDNKQKVPSIGPDPQCLLEFARLANALGFRSNTITSILNADADREHARNMLTIARPPGRYDYDLESEITGHCQFLTRISGRQQELLRPLVWTTTLSNIKVKQRYGRPHNQAFVNYPFLIEQFSTTVPLILPLLVVNMWQAAVAMTLLLMLVYYFQTYIPRFYARVLRL